MLQCNALLYRIIIIVIRSLSICKKNNEITLVVMVICEVFAPSIALGRFPSCLRL